MSPRGTRMKLTHPKSLGGFGAGAEESGNFILPRCPSVHANSAT
jgi:hypothetical protein